MRNEKTVYFMGIGGTGMASAAGLVQAAGYKVIGSDQALYPPMSTMLAELGIEVLSPYSPENLKNRSPDHVVIANALSRGHPELEFAIQNKMPLTSFPQLLGDLFLKDRLSLVVTGTHGKTTTTALLAHTLTALNLDPSYLIGGIPQNSEKSFYFSAKSPLFAIEGDEYDTAYFDKGPKFLHYHPKFLIINNIEFDHADIYKNLGEIKDRFRQLIELIPDPSCIIANIDDLNISSILKEMNLHEKIISVSADCRLKNPAIQILGSKTSTEGSKSYWSTHFKSKIFSDLYIRSRLAGLHNQYNIAHVIGLVEALTVNNHIPPPSSQALEHALSSFGGVKRRMEHLGTVNNIEVFEDFAHHPTAVAKVIEGFRKTYPNKRLIIAFEPKNATSRRNIFTQEYAKSFALAHYAFIGPCPDDHRLKSDEKMDTGSLAALIGPKARSFETNQALMSSIVDVAAPNDAIVFMSSGSFSGIQYQITKLLEEKFHS